MKALFLTTAGLILFDLVVRLIVARIVVRHFERRPRLRAPRFRPVPGSTLFSTLTADGIRIHGSILAAQGPAPRAVIVFCHEFSGQRWSFQNYCRLAPSDGIDIVTFDFGNLGDSESRPGYDPSHWITRHELADVESVLKFVRTQSRWNGVPILLMGASRGANAAVAVAATHPEVAGVVAIGAFSTPDLAFAYFLRGIQQTFAPALLYPRWHIRGTLKMAIAWSGWRRGTAFLDLTPLLSRLSNRPILLVSGDADHHVPLEVARQLGSRCGGAVQWIVPGGDHNRERDADPAGFDRRLQLFLQRCAIPEEKPLAISWATEAA